MSVFQVMLNNNKQGTLDVYPVANGNSMKMSQPASYGTTGSLLAGGKAPAPSLQRQVYVMGPNRINRLLKDGEIFTDCNYWKRFAYPQVSLEQAFIRVVEDDGSVYVDGAGGSTYPKVYTLVATNGNTYDENDSAAILTDTGGYAVFCQITNQSDASTGEDVLVRINGKADAIFTLAKGTSQVFNVGDLQISLVEVAHDQSGASQAVNVEVLVSVKSVCTS